MAKANIERLLWQLENGEISEDEGDLNEDEIDYYENINDQDLENDDDILDIEPVAKAEDGVGASDPPLVSEDSPQVQVPVIDYKKTRNLVWKKKNMSLVEEAFAFGGVTKYPENIMHLQTPFQFFSYCFDESLLKEIVEQSNKYAVQSNPNFSDTLTIIDLRKYIGILIYTSVYHYPSVRSYWANNVRFQPIADAMILNRFEKIREILHFNDNERHLPPENPNHDRLHKIRTVVDYLNQRFASVPFDHRLSVDEQMCSTKMAHFMKQYLPNKPHKWGFKLYVLCCPMGYAYSFEVYSGTQNHKTLPNEPNLGVVSNTVIRILRPVPRHVNHIVYFDNFYTNLSLFHYLHQEGIYCLGTVQRNRLSKSCKLPEKKDVLKTSVPRGSYEENVTSYEGVEFSATSWKDNKQVLLLSTYVGADPVDTIHRFDKKQKMKVAITCPKAILEYNANMGGVDTMDSYLGRYRIRMKSKKWTNRLFYHMLDMTIINSWVLYKKVLLKKETNPKHIMTLVEFRTELAETLCKYGTGYQNKRGRPSLNQINENAKPKKNQS